MLDRPAVDARSGRRGGSMAMPPTDRTAADAAAAVVGPDVLAAALAASADGVALLDEQ
jgi:hypothetical protein